MPSESPKVCGRCGSFLAGFALAHELFLCDECVERAVAKHRPRRLGWIPMVTLLFAICLGQTVRLWLKLGYGFPHVDVTMDVVVSSVLAFVSSMGGVLVGILIQGRVRPRPSDFDGFSWVGLLKAGIFVRTALVLGGARGLLLVDGSERIVLDKTGVVSVRSRGKSAARRFLDVKFRRGGSVAVLRVVGEHLERASEALSGAPAS